MVGVDVVVAAWRGAGSPAGAGSDAGVCARCRLPAALVATGLVVSKNFTGYDGWAAPGRGGLCPACTWAHSAAPLRARAHMVCQDGPRLVALERSALLQVLLRGAMAAGCAVVVPLRPGRKHVLGAATWGQVATEAGPMPWRAGDVARLAAVTRLRSAGFGTRMICQVAPAYPVLAALDTHRVPAVLEDWAALAPWRRGGAWLELALHATTAAASR